MKHPRLVLLLVMISFRMSFAQTSDFLVTTSGDTLRGKVKILSFDIDQASVNVAGKKKTFKASQVSVLKLKDYYYRPQRRMNSYRFMQLQRNGYMSLYGFRDANQSTYDGRFLVKKDGSSLELPNLGFKKAMMKFLDDCPEVAGKIESGALARGDINMIIDDYNACINKITQQRYETSMLYVSPTSPKMLLIDKLKNTVEGLSDFPEKKNTLELIADVREKLTRSQALPEYQLSGLREYLGTIGEVKDDLARFLEAVKPPSR